MIVSLTSFPFWIGFFYCTFYLLLPFLYSYFKTPDNCVWVPVNNQHRNCSDNRIYAACVQEARWNFFKYRHPCAPEIGNMALDFLRVSSYRTAAILGFFIRDDRWAFLLSFLFSVLIQYVFIFMVVISIFHYAWIALLVSLLVIFWFKILIYLNYNRGLYHVYNYIKNNIVNVNNNSYFDLINDNFRYVVMSVVGIYSWVTLILILYAINVPHPLFLYFSFLLYFIIIPYIYPPVSLMSIGLVISSVGLNSFLVGEYSSMFIMILSGSTALLLLISFGLISRIKAIRNSNLDALKNAHAQKENYQFSLKLIYNMLFKKVFFLLPLILFIVITPVVEMRFYFLSVILFICFSTQILGLVLRKTAITYRFIERGGIHYMFFAVICSIILIFQYRVLDAADFNLLSPIIIFGIAILPIAGCIKMAVALQKSGAYYMPKEEWDIYQYLKREKKQRHMVLAFSFSNMQLLPVYTHASLYIRGAEWNEYPEQELKKYIRSLAFIGSDVNIFLQKFQNYFKYNFSCSPSAANIDESMLKGYHLINTLIYFPYVTSIGDVKLANEKNNGWTQEFMEYLKNIIANVTNEPLTDGIDYILIDKMEFLNTSINVRLFKEIYSNRRYALFYKQ